MYYRLFTIYTIVAMLLVVPLTSKSQVTIGNDLDPRPGSILDLKEYDTKGENSTKGLMLPRVSLTHLEHLYPMLNDGYDKDTEDLNHTGLIVYNINTCFLQGSGPYAWDGSRWKSLIERSSDVYEYKDHEGNTFLARQFGEAGIWMTQNLAVTSYDKVRDSNNKTVLPAKDMVVEHPNKTAKLTEEYSWMGRLYNRNTATNNYILDNNGRVQGVCPSGWHVPTYNEWMLLENELIQNTTKYTTSKNNYIDQGVKLQTTHPNGKYIDSYYGKDDTHKLMTALLSPCSMPGKEKVNTTGVSLNAAQGGFAARLVGGTKDNNSTVDGYGQKAGFWMADISDNSGNGRNKVIIVKDTDIADNMVSIHNNDGGADRTYAIRCKKNNDIP